MKAWKIPPFRTWQYGETWWALDDKGKKMSYPAYHRWRSRQVHEGQELTDRLYNVKSKDKEEKVSGVLRFGKDGFVWLQLSDKKNKTAVQCYRLPAKKVGWRFMLYPEYPPKREWKVWHMTE